MIDIYNVKEVTDWLKDVLHLGLIAKGTEVSKISTYANCVDLTFRNGQVLRVANVSPDYADVNLLTDEVEDDYTCPACGEKVVLGETWQYDILDNTRVHYQGCPNEDLL